MIIVSNTSPIIYLASVGRLTLLKELYTKIYIPSEVWNELINPWILREERIPPDIKYEIEAKESGWLIIKDPEKEENIEIALGLSLQLDIGEAYAIALSLELDADSLLINDQKAKEIAESMGIRTKWITEVLVEAVEKKLLKKFSEFEDIFNHMVENGLWIRKSHYYIILDKVKKLLDK